MSTAPERFEQSDKTTPAATSHLSVEAQTLFKSSDPKLSAENKVGALDFGTMNNLYGVKAPSLPEIAAPGPASAASHSENGHRSVTPGIHPFSPQDITDGGASFKHLDGYKFVSNSTGFQASLAALAGTERGRQDLSDAITKNHDGSFTVTFPGDQAHPVHVTQNDLHGKDITATAEWAKVLQAASNKADPNESDSAKAFQLLTGEHAKEEKGTIGNDWWDSLRKDQTTISDISTALANGDAITAKSVFNTIDVGAPGQIYQIVSVDQGKGTVTLRNPEGDDVSTDAPGIKNNGGGKITVSSDVFRQAFENVEISKG